jgi:hypothetical protein
MYPVLSSTTGVDTCAETGIDESSPSDPTANSNAERKGITLTLLTMKGAYVGFKAYRNYGNNP